MEHFLSYAIPGAISILFLVLIVLGNIAADKRDVKALTKHFNDPNISYADKAKTAALLDDSPFLEQALIANGSLDQNGNPKIKG